MEFHFHIANLHVHLPDGLPVLDQLNQLTKQGATLMTALEALTLQVAKNTEIEKSAITLINGLSEQIKAAGTDAAKLKELTDTLDASDSALAAAVAANTAPAPVVVDPPLVP